MLLAEPRRDQGFFTRWAEDTQHVFDGQNVTLLQGALAPDNGHLPPRAIGVRESGFLRQPVIPAVAERLIFDADTSCHSCPRWLSQSGANQLPQSVSFRFPK